MLIFSLLQNVLKTQRYCAYFVVQFSIIYISIPVIQTLDRIYLELSLHLVHVCQNEILLLSPLDKDLKVLLPEKTIFFQQCSRCNE